jgi:hypothetical protein
MGYHAKPWSCWRPLPYARIIEIRFKRVAPGLPRLSAY